MGLKYILNTGIRIKESWVLQQREISWNRLYQKGTFKVYNFSKSMIANRRIRKDKRAPIKEKVKISSKIMKLKVKANSYCVKYWLV